MNPGMDRMGNLGPPVQFQAVEVMPDEIEMEKPFILYLDSLNTVSTINMQCLRQYIEMEYIDKKLPPAHKKYLEAPLWSGLSKTAMPHY